MALPDLDRGYRAAHPAALARREEDAWPQATLTTSNAASGGGGLPRTPEIRRGGPLGLSRSSRSGRTLWKRPVLATGLFVGALTVVYLVQVSPLPRPNVLLVTIDTLRADRLGCYGRSAAKTPWIDRLAREGVRFERCYASAPLTRPSHATILTGLEPFHHGVRDNLSMALPEGLPTLAALLGGEGWTSAAIVASDPLVRASGLDRGFGAYDDDLDATAPRPEGHFRERTADQVADRALGFLEGAGRRGPFFLWAHFFDPHAEYSPPAEYRRAGTPYDGEIAFVDAQLGRILAALEESGRLDDTIVVVTADHGEGLGDHGEATHGYFLYDSTLRVPLVVRWASGLEPGTSVADPVRLVDVCPTILDLAGVEGPPDQDGLSLSSAAKGGAVDARVAHAEAWERLGQFGWRPLVSVRARGWKIIDGGDADREIYRVGAGQDEGEEHDRMGSDEAADVLGNLRSEVEEDRAERPLRDPVGAAAGHDSRAARIALNAIPYSRHSPGEGAGSPPPEDPRRFLHDLHAAIDLAGKGLFLRALAEVDRLIGLDPSNPFLHLLAGRYADASGDSKRAILAYDTLIAIRRDDPIGPKLAIDLRIRESDWSGALRLGEEGATRWPEDAFFHAHAGLAHLELGRPGPAISALERAVELDPRSETYRRYLEAARSGG